MGTPVSPYRRSGIIKNACVIPKRTERNTELQNRKIIRVPALICGVGGTESGSRVECVGSGSWSAGQKLRIAESAQHQGKPLSSPLVWNLSQTLALFFRLCSVRWFRLAWFRCAWFGFDAIPFASSLTFSTLLPSNSPSLPLSRSACLPLYTLPCCLCNIPYPFATTRKKNTQRRQTTPLQDEHRDEHDDDDDGVAFALPALPPSPPRPCSPFLSLLAHPHPQRQHFNSNWYCRHCYCCCRGTLSLSLSSPFSLTLPATVWFPFDADKL